MLDPETFGAPKREAKPCCASPFIDLSPREGVVFGAQNCVWDFSTHDDKGARKFGSQTLEAAKEIGLSSPKVASDASQLADLRNRVYATHLRSFLTADPLGAVDSYGLFNYVAGDPVNFRDPWGLEASGVSADNPAPDAGPEPADFSGDVVDFADDIDDDNRVVGTVGCDASCLATMDALGKNDQNVRKAEAGLTAHAQREKLRDRERDMRAKADLTGKIPVKETLLYLLELQKRDPLGIRSIDPKKLARDLAIAAFAGAAKKKKGGSGDAATSKSPSLSAHKAALKEVQEKVGKLPKGSPGKFGSPTAGTPKKGYRLDPAHPNATPGSPEAGPHINWWDYSKGKKGRGGQSGAVPIKDKD